MFKRLIFFVFLFMNVNGFAQKSIRHYDSLTLIQLENQDWKKLIATGSEAIKEKKYFYYLYYRMGVAFFNLKKFRRAQQFFEKAYRFNQFDNELKESLFNTMKLNEYYNEAYRFSKSFSDSLKIKTATEKLPIINQLEASFAMNYPDSANYNQDGLLNFPLYDKFIYGLGINHRVTHGVSLYQHYTGISLNTDQYKFFQNHFFVQGNIPFAKHFTAQPSLSFITQKTAYTNSQLETTNNFYYLFSLNLKKSIPLFDFNVSGSASNFYSLNQYQFSGGIKFYPVGSNKLSISAEYIGMGKQYSDYSSGISLAGAYKPFSFLQLTASIYKGNNLFNQNFENGLVLNDNSTALLKSRKLLGCTVILPKKISLNFSYGADSKIYYAYNPLTLALVGSIKYRYNYFSTSFKINF